MTDAQLRRCYRLLEQGKNHWEALGIIHNVKNP